MNPDSPLPLSEAELKIIRRGWSGKQLDRVFATIDVDRVRLAAAQEALKPYEWQCVCGHPLEAHKHALCGDCPIDETRSANHYFTRHPLGVTYAAITGKQL